MEKNNTTQAATRPAFGQSILATAVVGTILFIALFAAQNAQAAITSSLDLGSQGVQVSELQTFLSTNSAWYPSRLVTGYFGPLTEAGVQKFQIAQGIVSNGTPASTGFGRVGPTTMSRINLMNNGGGVTNGNWDNVPVMSTTAVSVTGTTATFTWSTNEVTTGQVYWSTSAIQSDEATGPNQTPYISGTLALDAGGMQTSHSVTVSNLQSNTVYYYVIRSIDSAGNITMTMPFAVRTN